MCDPHLTVGSRYAKPWPVQVPMVQYRAEPYRPAAAYLYTANDPQTARAIAANLFQTANLSDTAEVANATELFRAGLAQVSGS